MGIRIDIHLHTSRYSTCSMLDPEKLIDRAIRSGLDGVCITEHQYQWRQDELEQLARSAGRPGFVLLSGFEYWSSGGDILIYGLSAEQAAEFDPGWPPLKAVERANALGGVCVAAHPTREGLGFEADIVNLPVVALEAYSVNLQPHESRLALKIAEAMGLPATAASDAHELSAVGRYCTEFLDPVRNVQELHKALKSGRFRMIVTGNSERK